MSADAIVAVSGEVSQLLPQAKVDNTDSGPARFGKYDEQYVLSVFPDMGVAALEGSYFTVNNGQTGLATAATPVSFSATNPFLLIYNSANPANPIAASIILDYAMLLNTAAGTAGVNVQFAITLDAGNRYSSAGTDLTNLVVNPNGFASAAKSVAKVYGGNITASAATAAVRTLVGNRWMKGAIPVAGDQYTVKFGGVDAPTFIGISTILFSLNNVPKVVVPPGWSMLLHIWLASQSAASSYAPEVGWIER